MKIIAELFRLPSGSLIPMLYGVSEQGEVMRNITDTLLDFVAESTPKEIEKLSALLQAVEDGTYERNDPILPDWSVNDKCLWIGPPKVGEGYILVSNENIPEYSMEEGVPQRFSTNQLLAALNHWKKFDEKLRIEDRQSLVGQKFTGMI